MGVVNHVFTGFKFLYEMEPMPNTVKVAQNLRLDKTWTDKIYKAWIGSSQTGYPAVGHESEHTF